MLSPVRITLQLLLFYLTGLFSSTLHLPRSQTFMLPQDRGFSLVTVDKDYIQAAGAEGQTQDVRLEREAREASPVQTHRYRRAAESPVPKVYGRVKQIFCVFWGTGRGASVKMTESSFVVKCINFPEFNVTQGICSVFSHDEVTLTIAFLPRPCDQ